MSQTLLVTGAAGQLGQRVLAHLVDTLKIAPSQIVAATRDPEKLSASPQRAYRCAKSTSMIPRC